jgi:hypothetical protein
MLDELFVAFYDVVLICGSTLCGSREEVKFVASDNSFAEAIALFNVEKTSASAALLGEQIALVLDYHLNGSFESADSGVIDSV